MQIQKCLITGCNGFIGSHLADFLTSSNLAICGIFHNGNEQITHLQGKIETFKCDLTDREQVYNIITQVKPDLVFHLAGKTGRNQSWKNPCETFTANVFGTINLLDALKDAAYNPLVIVACSASEYGYRTKDGLISETSKLKPSNPYAVSKVAEDFLASMYWRNYGLRVIRVRPFNITGPGMVGDACSDFAKGISEIERGSKSLLRVGTLSPVRDITDVSDAIKALWKLSNYGQPGEVYNICSGIGYRIEDLLHKLLSLSNVKIPVVEQSKNPKYTKNIQVGSNKKLQALGWKPTVSIDETLLQTLDYWRMRVLPL
jgi:GDP-4-dehydro-6-deoxy-D-mannose reductase